MESSKHNDELIKRKLDDVSAEPRKLKFAAVQANYQKAAKVVSLSKWGLYSIFAGIGVTVLLSAYLLLNNGTENTLAQNTSENSATTETLVISKAEKNTAASEEVSKTETSNNNSDNTASSDKVKEGTSVVPDLKTTNSKVKEDVATKSNERSSNTSLTKEEPKTTENSSTNSSKEKTSQKTKYPKSGTESTKEKHTTATKVKQSIATTQGYNKDGISNSDQAKKKEAVSVNSTSKNKISQESLGSKNKTKQNNTPSQNKEEKIIASTKVKSTSENSDQTTNETEKTKEHGNEKINEMEANNSDNKLALNSTTNENIKDERASSKQNNSKTPEGKKDPTILNASSKKERDNIIEEQNSSTSKQNTEDLKNSSTTNSVSSIINKTVTTSEVGTSTKTVTTTKQINQEVVGTGSVSARDKHQFLLSTEVIYSMIDYKVKANPNAAGLFYQSEPGFVQSYAAALGSSKYKLFNGSAYLSYVYKGGFGINAGIGFFNVESTVNTQGFGSKRSVSIIDSLVHAYDSINGWHVIDTTYKQQTVSNYAVVNGDTVKNQDYLNNLRFITIPIRLSYNIRIGGKFSVEPQAGIQLAIPVKSYQLVAVRAYEFEYKKTKANLNPNNLYFDLGLKLGYKISNGAQLYIKQGYFFRSKSVYPGNYALDYSLKSIYTTFGISIRLK